MTPAKTMTVVTATTTRMRLMPTVSPDCRISLLSAIKPSR